VGSKKDTQEHANATGGSLPEVCERKMSTGGGSQRDEKRSPIAPENGGRKKI